MKRQEPTWWWRMFLVDILMLKLEMTLRWTISSGSMIWGCPWISRRWRRLAVDTVSSTSDMFSMSLISSMIKITITGLNMLLIKLLTLNMPRNNPFRHSLLFLNNRWWTKSIKWLKRRGRTYNKFWTNTTSRFHWKISHQFKLLTSLSTVIKFWSNTLNHKGLDWHLVSFREQVMVLRMLELGSTRLADLHKGSHTLNVSCSNIIGKTLTVPVWTS